MSLEYEPFSQPRRIIGRGDKAMLWTERIRVMETAFSKVLPLTHDPKLSILNPKPSTLHS